MGGIASSSWPPEAASPSGKVGFPGLFFFFLRVSVLSRNGREALAAFTKWYYLSSAAASFG